MVLILKAANSQPLRCFLEACICQQPVSKQTFFTHSPNYFLKSLHFSLSVRGNLWAHVVFLKALKKGPRWLIGCVLMRKWLQGEHPVADNMKKHYLPSAHLAGRKSIAVSKQHSLCFGNEDLRIVLIFKKPWWSRLIFQSNSHFMYFFYFG